MPNPRATSPHWQPMVAPYARPDLRQALWQLANSLLPFLAMWPIMFWAGRISYWLVLPLALIAAAFWIRTFIIFHDCCHGSYFKSRRANETVGFILGILTLTPFHQWRHDHAIHHATAGNVDKRYTGDVPTMTVKEYLAAPWWRKAGYRIMRHPLFLFTIGSTAMFTLLHRIPPRGVGKREFWSVILTDLALFALLGGLGLLVGWKALLIVGLAVVVPATAAGVWLFYVQHQFEGVYWETRDRWNFARAGLEGSSFYALPRVLQWVTGNIGFHHIHHLSPKVPSYRLEACHKANPALQVKPLTLLHSLKGVRLHLIDDATCKLVGWDVLRSPGQTAPLA